MSAGARPGGPRRPYRPAGPRKADVAVPYPEAPRLILGLQPVREAIRAHQQRLRAVLLEDTRGESRPRLEAVSRLAASQGVAHVEWVARRHLDAIAGATLHQGAAAWASELALVAPSDILSSPGLLAVALDEIQDPQNFGAIVRSAVALGATGVVWPEHAAAPLRAATFRASAGAIEHARLCRVPSLVNFLDDARAGGAEVVGLAPEADRIIQDVDLRLPTVIVVGSEHEGLGRAVRKRCSTLARLSLPGPVESLNASVACAVTLYQALIQRGNSPGSTQE